MSRYLSDMVGLAQRVAAAPPRPIAKPPIPVAKAPVIQGGAAKSMDTVYVAPTPKALFIPNKTPMGGKLASNVPTDTDLSQNTPAKQTPITGGPATPGGAIAVNQDSNPQPKPTLQHGIPVNVPTGPGSATVGPPPPAGPGGTPINPQPTPTPTPGQLPTITPTPTPTPIGPVDQWGNPIGPTSGGGGQPYFPPQELPPYYPPPAGQYTPPQYQQPPFNPLEGYQPNGDPFADIPVTPVSLAPMDYGGDPFADVPMNQDFQSADVSLEPMTGPDDPFAGTVPDPFGGS